MSLWKNRGEEFKGKNLYPESNNQFAEVVNPASERQLQPIEEPTVRMPATEACLAPKQPLKVSNIANALRSNILFFSRFMLL